jgi:hypothetical protein
MITVPACKKCNGGSNLDDEFMQRLALSAEAESNRDAQQVCWNVLRAMNKPEKKKMRAGFHRTITPVNLFSPMGLYLGPTFSFSLDGKRLFRILVKITVGMLWEMTRRRMKRQRIPGFSESSVPRLPSDYRAFVHQVGEGPKHEDLLKTERNIPLVLPAHRIGEGTFIYRYLIDDKDPFISVWGFSFYGFFHVVGFTGRNDGTYSHFLGLKDPPPG